jgi:hypothetical protein
LGIVGNFVIEASEIKSIQDIVFLDFTEVFVALGREKPGYPLQTRIQKKTLLETKAAVLS